MRALDLMTMDEALDRVQAGLPMDLLLQELVVTGMFPDLQVPARPHDLEVGDSVIFTTTNEAWRMGRIVEIRDNAILVKPNGVEDAVAVPRVRVVKVGVR
jgi:hypothetical protein